MNNEPNKIYITLDALYDTRITVLKLLNPTIAENMLKTETWGKRYIDSFGSISAEYFNVFYEYRDKTILFSSEPTYILDILSNTVRDRREYMLSKGLIKPIHITLNTYPYKLTEEETLFFKSEIKNHVLSTTTIEVVHVKNIQIDMISNGYEALFLYDGVTWVSEHSDALIKNSMPGLTIVTPSMVTTEDGINETTGEVFKNICESCSMYVGIEFIDTKYFSLKKEK